MEDHDPKKKISFIDHSIEYEYLLFEPNEGMEKSINNRRECDKRLIETRNPWPERSRKSTRGSRSVLALTDRRPRIYALLTHTSVPSNRSTIAPFLRRLLLPPLLVSSVYRVLIYFWTRISRPRKNTKIGWL